MRRSRDRAGLTRSERPNAAGYDHPSGGCGLYGVAGLASREVWPHRVSRTRLYALEKSSRVLVSRWLLRGDGKLLLFWRDLTGSKFKLRHYPRRADVVIAVVGIL